MSTLAKDIGAAPPLWELYHTYGIKVLLIYCFGAAFTSFYRLLGPFKDPAMKEVVEGELKDTVMRRGLTGNFFFGVVPMLFYGCINLLAHATDFFSFGALSAYADKRDRGNGIQGGEMAKKMR